MSGGPSWYSWLSFPFFAPLSGSVAQDFSPQLYQGVPEIEAAVVKEAGSFGRQLGILSDAVLELARSVDPSLLVEDPATLLAVPDGDLEPPLRKLQKLVVQVDRIKARYAAAAEADAGRALDRLRAVDPDAHGRLAARFRE